MKNMKKWLSVLLTVAMLATTLCMPVFAADATSDKTAAGDYVYKFLNGNITDTPMNFYDLAVKEGWSYSSADQTVAYSGEDTYVAQIKLKPLTGDGTTLKASTQFNTFCNTCFYAAGGTEYLESNSKNGFVPISGVGDGKTTFGDRGTTLGVSIREQSYVSINYGILATVTWEQEYTDDTGFVDSMLTVTYQPLPGFSYTATKATLQDVATVNDYISVFAEQEFEAVCEPLMFQVGTDSDYANSSITNGMCYVFRLSDGTFVIYDGGGWGGTTYDNVHNITIANRLLAVLDEYNVLDEITISAWVLTHPHNDHMQAFGNIVTRIANSEITNVKIERIIANIPDFTEQTAYSTSFDWSNWEFDVDAKTDAATLMSYHNLFDTLATVQGTYVYKAHVGQKYFLADASIEILYTHDVHEGKIPNGAGQDSNDQGDSNDINGISIISQVTMWKDGDTVMMTGDASYRGIDWVNAAYGKKLASTYVQAPHHGHPSCFMLHNAYDGVDHLDCERKFYENVSADYLLWPCGKGRFRELNVAKDEGDVDNGIEYAGRTGVDVPTREYARYIGMDDTYVALCMTTMFDFFDDDGAQLAKHEVTYLLRTQKDLKEGMPVEDGNYKLIDDIIINQDIDHTGETMTDSDGDGTDDTYVSDGALTTRLIRQSYSTDDTNNSGTNFTGTLDGQGHSIIFADGMSFAPQDSYIGILFESLNSCTVKNLGIGTEASPVIYNDSMPNPGIFAGSVLANATPVIDGVKMYVTFDGTGRSGSANIGGFVGKFTTAGATLTVKNSTVDISFTEGAPTAARNVGGLVGYINAASNVKAIGNTISVDITTAATGESAYGGLVGKIDKVATVIASDNNVTFNITDSSTSEVVHNIGGLVGNLVAAAEVRAIGNTVNADITTTVAGTSNFAGLIANVADASVYATENTVNFKAIQNSTAAVEQTLGGLVGYSTRTIFNTLGNKITLDVTDNTTSATAHYIGGIVAKINVGAAYTYDFEGDKIYGSATTVGGNNHYVGGFVGYSNINGKLDIDNAYSDATLTSKAGNKVHFGGAIGYNKGTGSNTISNTTVEGAVNGTARTGGFLGTNQGNIKIDSCISNATVKGTVNDSTGGFIGYENSEVASIVDIENSINRSSATSTKNHSGGFIGYANASVSTITITNCINEGTIKATANYAGGIIGAVNSGSAAITISKTTNAGAVTSVSHIGGMIGNISSTSGAITVENSNNTGILSAGGYAGGVAGYINGATGDITIRKFHNSAVVKDTDDNVLDATADSAGICSTGKFAAGVIGAIKGANKFAIENSVNSGTISAGTSAGVATGGIVGKVLAGASTVNISGCYNTGMLYGITVGGILGDNRYDTSDTATSSVTIDGCYNSGKISGTSYIGGILGSGANSKAANATTTISNCINNTESGFVDWNDGTISGYAGGILGYGDSKLTASNVVDYDALVGWAASSTGVATNATINLDKSAYGSLKAPSISFEGASMRVKDTDGYTSGLTFKMQVDTTEFSKYVGNAKITNLKLGVLLVPTHMLEACNNIFTATSVAAAQAVEFTGDEVDEIIDDNGYFYASLVGFNESWANTEFSAIGYISFTVNNGANTYVVYGDYDPADARSIAYVAKDLVDNNQDALAEYSDAQQAMINTYAGLYVENN